MKRMRKIISLLAFALLFAGVVQLSNILFYTFAPFEHFITWEKFELIGMNGDSIFIKLTNRHVRGDIKASSVKELHRIEPEGLYQIPRACELACEDFFVFEEENNDKDNRYEINWGTPITEPGDYFIVEHFTLYLPYGITKQKSLESKPYHLE